MNMSYHYYKSISKIQDMKKILLTVFAAAMVAASCTKESAMKESPAAERVTLGICAPVEKMTKVAELEGERTVNRIQAFVFKENGDIDAWNVSETDEVTVECSAGQREIVVVANAPDIEGVFSLSDLESRVSLLEDNSLGFLVMAGRTSMELTASSTVVVPVFRRVARISIERIVTEFKMDQFKETDFVIKGIYLTNVAGDVPYLSDGDPSLWLNKMGLEVSGAGLFCSGEMSMSLAPGVAYETAHHFYCYPNASEDSFGQEWSPRHTRLVVEASIGGITCYYPMTMPEIKANHSYTVTELKITGSGSWSPEDSVSPSDASFSVDVQEWQDGYSGKFEI